jgi:hypothetical protein
VWFLKKKNLWFSVKIMLYSMNCLHWKKQNKKTSSKLSESFFLTYYFIIATIYQHVTGLECFQVSKWPNYSLNLTKNKNPSGLV